MWENPVECCASALRSLHADRAANDASVAALFAERARVRGAIVQAASRVSEHDEVLDSLRDQARALEDAVFEMDRSMVRVQGAVAAVNNHHRHPSSPSKARQVHFTAEKEAPADDRRRRRRPEPSYDDHAEKSAFSSIGGAEATAF